MADAEDLKSFARKGVWVRLPPRALSFLSVSVPSRNRKRRAARRPRGDSAARIARVRRVGKPICVIAMYQLTVYYAGNIVSFRMKEIVQAVLGSEVRSFFESLNLLQAFERGEFTCHKCGDVINVENFRAVTRHHGGLMFSCNKNECLSSLASLEP